MSSNSVQSATVESRQRLLDVMAGVAAGDKTALANLYELTSAKLFGICLRICGDRVAAEDVLQETYLKIWHRADQYNAAKASPISWLAIIARNTAIDWRRKYGNDRPVDADVMDIIADDAALADETIEQEQQKARIMDCLEQLDEKQNAPIRSAFFDGLTYADLAEKLEVPLSTMKSRIRRGLKNLKKCIEDG